VSDLYQWFVVIHLLGLVVFAIAHGVSVFTAFRVRRVGDPATVATMLDLSKAAVGPVYVGLLLLLVGGVGAAWGANLWFEPWILASVAVLVVVVGVMYALATPYYIGIRQALEPRDPDGHPVIDPAELTAMLDTRRPEILVTVGGVGLVVLIWLMVVKPG
jgi:hypothetical protein